MKKRKKSKLFGAFPLGAGLLVLGSLALPFSSRAGEGFFVRVEKELVTLHARAEPRADVIAALAAEANLRLVLHAEPPGKLTAAFDAEPLATVVASILEGDSYQLLQQSPPSTPHRHTAGTLWIFSGGRPAEGHRTAGPEARLLDGDFAKKKTALRKLRDPSDEDAVQALGLALADPDARIRDVALEALGRIGTDESLAAIASLASDQHYWTRIEAANALSLSDSPSAVEHLELMLTDPDPRVRIAVLEALTDIPGAGSILAIRRARQDPDPEVRAFAGEALEDAYTALALASGRNSFSP